MSFGLNAVMDSVSLQFDPEYLTNKLMSALKILYPREEINDRSFTIDSVDLLCHGKVGERFSKVKFTLTNHPEQDLVWYFSI